MLVPSLSSRQAKCVTDKGEKHAARCLAERSFGPPSNILILFDLIGLGPGSNFNIHRTLHIFLKLGHWRKMVQFEIGLSLDFVYSAARFLG